jgi:hypothetical protein
VPSVWRSGNLKLLENSGPVGACNGIDLAYNWIALACNGTALACNGPALAFNGIALACNGIALACNGIVLALRIEINLKYIYIYINTQSVPRCEHFSSLL